MASGTVIDSAPRESVALVLVSAKVKVIPVASARSEAAGVAEARMGAATVRGPEVARRVKPSLANRRSS